MSAYPCCIHCDHDPGYVHEDDCLSCCTTDDEPADLNWWPDDE